MRSGEIFNSWLFAGLSVVGAVKAELLTGIMSLVSSFASTLAALVAAGYTLHCWRRSRREQKAGFEARKFFFKKPLPRGSGRDRKSKIQDQEKIHASDN